jgi:AcrR family transcriptional regulator
MEAMSDGRRQRGAATRERLVTAARELFGQRGYDATSIEAVLEVSEVARGALYHHFASKAELFNAVAEEVFVEIAERTALAAAGDPDPRERIRAGSRQWLEMALDPAVQRIALLDPPTALGWSRWRALDERYTLGGLRSGFELLERQGRIPAGQGELLANMLLATLNEAALFIAGAEDEQAALSKARATLDTLLDRLVRPELADVAATVQVAADAGQSSGLATSPIGTARASR